MEIKEPAHTFPATERLGAGLTGLFLMCFGTPFTLVPFFILPNVMSFNNIGPSLVLLCFTVPFLVAGLAVQYAGFASLRVALFPNSEKALKAIRSSSILGDETHTRNTKQNYYPSKSQEELTNEIREKEMAQKKSVYVAPPSTDRAESMNPSDVEEQSNNFWDNVEVETS